MLGEAVLRAERLTGSREHECGVAKRRERDPPDAVGVRVRGEARRLQRKPRLPGPARAREGEQARVVGGKELDDLRKLALPPEEGRGRHGQVRAVEALEGGEVAVSELVDALGGGEVLEPVLAEVSELELDERSGGGRDEHLPAVAAGSDAGSAVDVGADVALLGQERRSGVQADPHRDRA